MLAQHGVQIELGILEEREYHTVKRPV